MSELGIQVVALQGSLGVLGAYAAAQFRWLSAKSLWYALLNLVGSGTLAAIALVERQWGFLLLEGVWALISLWQTERILRGRRHQATTS